MKRLKSMEFQNNIYKKMMIIFVVDLSIFS